MFFSLSLLSSVSRKIYLKNFLEKSVLVGTDNSVVIAGMGGVEGDRGGDGGINGDGWTLDLGRWTLNTVYRWCVAEVCTWNLYDFADQCDSNKFNKKEKMLKLISQKQVNKSLSLWVGKQSYLRKFLR